MSKNGSAVAAPTLDELVDEMLPVEAITRRFGIARSICFEMMADGRLAYSKPGRKRLISVASVKRLLAQSLVGAPSQATSEG